MRTRSAPAAGPSGVASGRMRAGSELVATVDATVGIYGTAPTCYLSALARLPGFVATTLTRAIEQDRSLVRARLMRNSVHAVPHDLLAVALPATRKEALRGYASFRSTLGTAYPRLARQAEAALAGGPLPAAEIRLAVNSDLILGGGFNLFLGLLAAECRIVRATTVGGWRSNRLTYARWGDWLPGVDPAGIAADEARRHLAARYLAAYGPATVDDVRWWTGWSAADTRAATADSDLTVAGTALVHLEGIRLLPVWDVFMVAYRHRDRLLDPDRARFVYDRFGNATSVVLDGGRVVGVWDLGRSDDPLGITVAPFGPWTRRRWADVEAEAGRIAAMIGAETVTVSAAAEPVDLVAAPRNRFRAPLSQS